MAAVFLMPPKADRLSQRIIGKELDPSAIKITGTADAQPFLGTRAAYPNNPLLPSKELSASLGVVPGAPVAVLLSVEVLGTHRLGHIAVERSGGSPTVDHAAVQYVRALDWQGAVLNGVPYRATVRFGVYFQA